MKYFFTILLIGLLKGLILSSAFAQIPSFNWDISIEDLKKENSEKRIWGEIDQKSIHQITYDNSFLKRKVFITYIFVLNKLNKVSYAFIDQENTYQYKKQNTEYMKVREFLSETFGENELIVDERGFSSIWITDTLELFHVLSPENSSNGNSLHHLEFRKSK